MSGGVKHTRQKTTAHDPGKLRVLWRSPVSENDNKEGVASDRTTEDKGGVYNAEGCDCGCCCCSYSYCYDCGCPQCTACYERAVEALHGSNQQ